jgi:hypothetical protein
MKLNSLVLVFVSGCLLAAGVKTGYDRLADFSQLKTYSWIAHKSTNDAWADFITRDVDRQLAAKGWAKLQTGGDVVVSAFGRTRDQQTLESFYTDVGGPWKWQGTGDTAADQTPVGTLVVDIFEGHSKKLIWRGTATEILAQEPDKERLEQSVEYMFRDFPSPQN